MEKIRAILIDDEVHFRKEIATLFEGHDRVNVVGVAQSGRIGLQKITREHPDVVLLDLDMPEMSSLKTIQSIRESHSDIPIIIFSQRCGENTDLLLDAIAAGAADHIMKPTRSEWQVARDSFAEQLATKIETLCPLDEKRELNGRKTPHGSNGVDASQKGRLSISSPEIAIIAIGVSTGGPNALAEIVPKLPADLGVPIVCVQHMPAGFTKILAQRLDATSQLRVFEGEDGMRLEPNTMYIAPGEYHMQVARSGKRYVLRLNQEPAENSCRPAVDPLFRSVARHFGQSALGVILTGMGSDGLLGAEALKNEGATILAQDKKTSVVWGMPGYVVERGLADSVFPLQEMAAELTRRVRRSSSRARIGQNGVEVE